MCGVFPTNQCAAVGRWNAKVSLDYYRRWKNCTLLNVEQPICNRLTKKVYSSIPFTRFANDFLYIISIRDRIGRKTSMQTSSTHEWKTERAKCGFFNGGRGDLNAYEIGIKTGVHTFVYGRCRHCIPQCWSGRNMHQARDWLESCWFSAKSDLSLV